MASRLAITLSCDVCGASVPHTFRSHKQVAAWMRRQGWKFWSLQDWCPACVMRDRQKQRADAGAPHDTTPKSDPTRSPDAVAR